MMIMRFPLFLACELNEDFEEQPRTSFAPPNTYQLVGIIPLRIVLAIITEETRDEWMSSMVLITPTWGAFVPPLCAHLSVTEE